MIKLFFSYFLRFRGSFQYLILILIGDFIVLNLALVTPMFSKLIFDYAYPLKSLHLLTTIIIIEFLFFVCEFSLNVFSDFIGMNVEQRYRLNLTESLINKFFSLSMGETSKWKQGDLINYYTRDVAQISNFCLESIPVLLLQTYSLTFILIMAISMNIKVTIFALMSVPLFILETKFFANKAEAVQEEELHLTGSYFDCLTDKIQYLKTIKAFGQEQYELNQVTRQLRKLNILEIKESILKTFNRICNTFSTRIWSIFVGWYLGYLVIIGQLTVGELMALLLYLGMITGPVKALADLYHSYRISSVSFRRVEDFLKQPSQCGHLPLPKLEGGPLELINISHDFGRGTVLENISMRIGPTQSVAILGKSGSGKSTLLSLLMRYFDPSSGSILLAGQDISQLIPHEFRTKIGFVDQDFALFEGTLWDNIVYGKMNATVHEVQEAAARSNINEFVKELPLGFETWIGRDGHGLSVGQAQRVAFSRVLLKNPDIIILDEPTSALDADSEAFFAKVIEEFMGKKMLIIATHRLSIIKKVETIYLIENKNIHLLGDYKDAIKATLDE